MMKRFLLMAILFFASGFLYAKQVPEFTDSVIFQENFPKFKINELKGKVIVVVFFQSWCPKCNEWSKTVFNDTENAYGNDPSVVLIALKTDSSSLSSANDYLKNRIKSDKWIVGVDKNAEYLKLVNGKDQLYVHMIVDGAGEIREVKYSGTRLNIKGKTVQELATHNFSNGYHSSRLLASEKTYDSVFNQSVKLAEMYLIKEAVLECRKSPKDKEQKAQALELEEDIYQGVLKKLQGLKEQFSKEDDQLRFTYFQSIRSMVNSVNGLKVHKDAMAIYSEIRNEEFLKKELQAEKAYITVQASLSKVAAKDYDALKAKYFSKIASDYPDTYYGRITAEK